MLRRGTSRCAFALAVPSARTTFARRFCSTEPERDVEEYDVVVVGAGPSGLSAAIRLKQLANENNKEDFRIALVEKGSTVGAHILSGACIEPRAMNELIPDWKEKGAPLNQEAGEDRFYLLTETSQFQVPHALMPRQLNNHGNYIVSLGDVCKWLGEQAEGMGIDVFCGFAASQAVYTEKGAMNGVQLNDVGINKKGEKSDQFQPGMILKAKQTIISEGCRGSLTKGLFDRYRLRKESQPQTYGLGIKEVWELPKEKHHPGLIVHTMGWPLTKKEGHDNTYGGSWMYHYGDGLVSTGFVTGLDYTNPYTRPYMEMQKWKTHPLIRDLLEGGKPIGYGARTLSEGGLASLPKLTFPGGVLVGDCAGFLNLPKIKGTHAAMKSGMLAAEAIWDTVKTDALVPGAEVSSYTDRFKSSWLYKELYEVRNVRQMFAGNKWAGVLYTGITAHITRGSEGVTMPHKHVDHETLLPAKECKPINYPKPDGKLTFDILTNHSRSGTAHNADQPAHLKLTQEDIAVDHNLAIYDGPEGRYCPAGVYEFVKNDEGEPKLVINAQNCLHCKTCDIKDPTQNINFTCPEGSGGPNYTGM